MSGVLKKMLSVEYFTRKFPLLIGTVLLVASTFYKVFANYIDAMKTIFHLSPSEVELLGTVNIAVAISTMFSGIVHDNKGATISLLTGMITWSAGTIILCWSVIMVSVVNIPTALLTAGMLLCVHGRTYAFITGLVTIVHTVSPRYRPVASAFTEVASNSGTLFYTLIYDGFFQNGHVLDPQNQNILGYFIMLTCVAVIVHVFSMLGLSRYETTVDLQSGVTTLHYSPSGYQWKYESKDAQFNSTETSKCISYNYSKYGSNESEMGSSSGKDGRHFHEIADNKYPVISGNRTEESKYLSAPSLWSIILKIDFILFILGAALVEGCCFFFSVHIAILAKSLNFALHYSALILIYRTLVVVGLLLGFVLMLLIKKTCIDFILLQVGNVLSLSAYVCMAFDMTHIWSFYTASVMIGLSYGLVSAVIASIVEHFSSHYLGTFFGIVKMFDSLLLVILLPTFGALYSSHIPKHSGSIYCYGPECINITIWILVCLTFISTGACIVFLIRMRKLSIEQARK